MQALVVADQDVERAAIVLQTLKSLVGVATGDGVRLPFVKVVAGHSQMLARDGKATL